MIRPFILSGGSGTRLWPLSRRSYPKQFLRIVTDHSLLQDTCLRVSSPLFAPPVILANAEHRFLVAEHLAEIGIEAQDIVLEPVARNTAPAAAIAALIATGEDEDSIVLLLSSDHIFADAKGFEDSMRAAMDFALRGDLVIFGVKPDCPHSGYGYIEVENLHEPGPVLRFVEKPPRQLAQTFLDSASFLWNAGIFAFRARTLISQFERHAPDILEHCRNALTAATRDLGFTRLDEPAYSKAQSISLDNAIVEKASGVTCVPLQTQWSDIGSWSAAWEAGKKDSRSNVVIGTKEAIVEDATDCLVYSDHTLVSLLGVSNLVVIATKDAILVADKDRSDEVRKLTETLIARNRPEAVWPNRVYRPWGWYEGLSEGERFQVKCIVVNPGGQLSLQSHLHRSEHWVVVRGTVEVTKGENTMLLSENQSTYIALGERHRLANPGKIPAFLIEVQSGDYIGEDDIVRFEDVYGRA